MSIILTHAFENGFIKRRINLSIPDENQTAGRELSIEEIRRLKFHAGDELAFQIELAWRLGLRLREMLFLRWAQIDWQRRTIVLGRLDTKTRAGREVPLPTDLLEQLEARKKTSDKDFVFPGTLRKKDHPVRVLNKPQYSNKCAWNRCKRMAGITARWHDLRHTCATVMLRRGVRVDVAKKILGMSEKVLHEIYTHLNLDDLHAAAALMNDHPTAVSRVSSTHPF